MTKYARMAPAAENGDRLAIETLVTDAPLETLFHPSLVDAWIQVPNAVVAGSVKHGATWTHPAPVPPPAAPPVIQPVEAIDAALSAALAPFSDSAQETAALLDFARSRPWYVASN